MLLMCDAICDQSMSHRRILLGVGCYRTDGRIHSSYSIVEVLILSTST